MEGCEKTVSAMNGSSDLEQPRPGLRGDLRRFVRVGGRILGPSLGGDDVRVHERHTGAVGRENQLDEGALARAVRPDHQIQPHRRGVRRAGCWFRRGGSGSARRWRRARPWSRPRPESTSPKRIRRAVSEIAASSSALNTTRSSVDSSRSGRVPASAASTRRRAAVCVIDTARPTRAQWSSCCLAERLCRAPSTAAESSRSAATRVGRSEVSRHAKPPA